MSNYVLYHFAACPFCVRVRHFMQENDINIEERDIRENPQYREELKVGGGSTQVPCLYIKDEGSWMYESMDIIRYLQQNYSK